jgi:hypothetical protein
MAYRFQCPRCGSDAGLLVKLQSTPFELIIEDGPSIRFDLPSKIDDAVSDANFTEYEISCRSCQTIVMRIADMATLTADALLKDGYIVEVSDGN